MFDVAPWRLLFSLFSYKYTGSTIALLRSYSILFYYMTGFNHYARLKQIIELQPTGWYIMQINQPTTATNFKGETTYFDHHYRLYAVDGTPIRYGKFQQLDRLALVLRCDVTDLSVVDPR